MGPLPVAHTYTRIRFSSTILGTESRLKSRVNTVSVHALQPQLFLINQPASACQGSTWRGGGVAQSRATTSRLRPKGARVDPDPNRASTRWMQMLVQPTAGFRPASTEPFTVSRIHPYRPSACTYEHVRFSANALALICTRVSRNVRGSRCCSVASRTDQGSNLPGFGLLCVDVAAAVRPLYRRCAPPTVGRQSRRLSAPPAGVESPPGGARVSLLRSSAPRYQRWSPVVRSCLAALLPRSSLSDGLTGSQSCQ